MKNKPWTDQEIEKLRILRSQGKTIKDCSRAVGRTYTATEHAIRRFGITINDADSDLFFDASNPKKLTYTQLNEISKYIGEKVFENYKVIKFSNPKPVRQLGKREEHSILDLSDVHIGMINEVLEEEQGRKIVTYNMDIFKKELAKLQDSVFQIHQILRESYKLPEITINVLGDIITNDRIFNEQTFEIEKVVGLQIWDAINYFSQFFVNLLNIYEKVNVVCVVGNHGRSHPHHFNEPVENNFEYFIYKTWEKQFADNKRINIVVPDTRRFVHKIGNWKHLIEHGDSLRGSSTSYIERQLSELATNMKGFDVVHYGHFHKLKELEIADKYIVKQNGCWISKDSYGFNRFRNYSIPKQWFFGCNAKRPETWAYKLDLRV